MSSLDWSDVFNSKTANQKAEKFHETVNEIYDKDCPIRKVRVLLGKPVLTSLLIRKLQRAKKCAYQQKNPAWKSLSLSKIVSHHQSLLLQKQTHDEINNAVRGSKLWWTNINYVVRPRTKHKTYL